MSHQRNPAALSRRTIIKAIPAVIGATGLSLAAAQPSPAATVVYASDFGFDPADSTPALTAALDSDADVVIIDNVGQDWITGPLWIRRDDVTVILADGVVLRGKVNSFPDKRDGIWRIDSRRNVKLIGYGATCVMDKAEYTGEWRAIVRIGASDSIVVEGLVLRGAPGDGLIVGKSLVEPTRPPVSNNIVVRNVVCDDNKRNAISVISVNGLLIEGCALINTSGTLPQAGIDIEPDLATEYVKDVIIRDCAFLGNETSSFMINLMKFTAESHAVSVLVERCLMGPAGDAVVHVQPGAGGAAGGSVTFRDCLFDAGSSPGTVNVYAFRAYDGMRVNFERVSFAAMGDPARTNPLIKIWSGLIKVQPFYGSVRFLDNNLHIDLSGPFLAGVEGPGDPVLSNVMGTFRTDDPERAVIETTGATQEVEIEVLPRAATGVLVLQTNTHVVSPGRQAVITITRLSRDLSGPLAIPYGLSGSARHRVDYDGMSGVAVIAPGERSVTIPLRVRRNARTATQATLTLSPLPGYTVHGFDRVTIVITK